MRDAFSLICLALIGLFRSRASLQVEILTLRHQLNVLRRKSPQRLIFTGIDRLVFAGLYRLAPGMLNALAIVKPETVIRWHRAGFRAYWRWKSRPRGGRPKTPLEIRHLIREMSLANPLWGAPRMRAAVSSHACGFFGIPSRAHVFSAASNASASASSAPAGSWVRAASSATRRPYD